ncbi:MAG: glycosyltransferase family 39 protein [Ferrovibrio sp.]
MDNKKYEWLAAGVILLQAGCWILVPYFTLPNPPIDVLEGFVWGQNFQFGYHKGPPLFAWLLGLGDTVLHGSLLPALVFSQIAIAVTYWAVWRLAKRILGPRDGLAVLGLTTTIYYFGFPSPEFNPIILQMAFSALTCSFFYSAIVEGRQRDWIMVGLAVGFGFLARYSLALYLLPMAVFTLAQPEMRWRWLTPVFAIGVVIAIAIIAPHIWWVATNDLTTLHYIDHRAGIAEGFARLTKPLKFAAAQISALLPAIVVFILAILPLRRCSSDAAETRPQSALTRNYLIAIGIAPALFVFVMAILLGRQPRAMWGAGLWIFTPLLAVALLREYSMILYRRRLMAVWTVVFLLPVLAFAVSMILWPSISGRNRRTHFPGPALAEISTSRWHEVTGRPLGYVAGEMWLAGSVGYYSPDRPRVFQNSSLIGASASDLDQIKACGVLALYQETADRDEFVRQFSELGMEYEELPSFDLPKPRFAAPSEYFRIGWLFARPSSDARDTHCDQHPR